ncbi:DUF881 domain-containing protein [Halobacillus shinanisalinarum]|uniref:DUF881 domain-containing protein n=1 Tax=Halobacillus shinanisalinarum TaxID=2932258 RepID=A0ABY4GY06_9BACI|nr:DUF881 domain-containing protein [Halobacillus shinanisalinarum]UOQ93085.1 DUF881 domain-containing protein [Halobacillus shinanisalinarum]
MRIRGKSLLLSLVLLLTGFLVAYSYQQTKNEPQMVQLNDTQWEKEYFYQQKLLEIEQRNKQLRDELREKRGQIQQFESNLAESEQMVVDYVEKKKELQLLAGELPVKGPGVKVTLSDAQYVPEKDNINNYIVHESHIHLVINELLSAGAKAVSINGQRYFRDSYISCTGPVVTVDGIKHSAPFVISAIGDSHVLYSSLDLTRGVIDQLENKHVDVQLMKDGEVKMEARLTSER